MTERRLLTIPISHFCEKARWALERAGLAYREERHVQGVNRIVSKRAGGHGTLPVLICEVGRARASRRRSCATPTRTCARRSGCSRTARTGSPRCAASSTPGSAPTGAG